MDKNNRLFTSEQYIGRVQMFRYVTDDEARVEKAKRDAEEQKTAESRSAGVKAAAAAQKESAAAKPQDSRPQ
jgi:hypothetical protein